MALPRLFTTPSFRISVLSAALFSVAALVVFGTVYWAATGFMARQVDGSIVAQFASLRADGHAADRSRLAEAVERRLASPGDREYHYLLLDGLGHKLAGSLPAMAPKEGWQTLPLPDVKSDDGDEHALRALGKTLPDGSFLLIGRDVYDLDEVTDFMEQAFAAGFALTLVVAVAGGALVSAGFLRRLDDITRTSREIMAGDLSRRIPVGRGNDDFARLSANLNGMLERIQALMEGVRQVTDDIAHDMRTPLTRLRHRLERARTGARTVAEFEAAIDGALAETDALLDTFAALLRIAQIASGSRRAGFVATDLSAVARTIAETFAPVAEDDGRVLTATIADGVTIEGDRHLLTQMLANLVENALKHTPPGCRVHIALGRADGGPCLVVTDDGPGIPAADRDKVFRRFYRLDASRHTAGSGLGLSLVAAVAELHGAGVSLDDNRPGLRAGVCWPNPRPRPGPA